MKNKKGSNAAVAGIVIVMVIVLAFVVPWTLSLIDTTPEDVEANRTRFYFHPGDAYTSSIANTITFHQLVEVRSLSEVQLLWVSPGTGTCTIQAQFQVSNGVNAIARVAFESRSFSSDGKMMYSAPTTSGDYEDLIPGDYYLVITAYCTEPDQEWGWIRGLGSSYDAAVVSPKKSCADWNPTDGYWQPDDECLYPISCMVVEGRLYTAEPPPEEEEVPPPLITTIEEEKDYDWLMYAILGGVVIIVLVVIVVAVKF